MYYEYEAPDKDELCDCLVGMAANMRYDFRQDELSDGEGSGMDIRLRVYEGGWEVLSGDPSFDQDHRGIVASGWLPYDADAEMCDEIVEDLLETFEELRSERSSTSIPGF